MLPRHVQPAHVAAARRAAAPRFSHAAHEPYAAPPPDGIPSPAAHACPSSRRRAQTRPPAARATTAPQRQRAARHALKRKYGRAGISVIGAPCRGLQRRRDAASAHALSPISAVRRQTIPCRRRKVTLRCRRAAIFTIRHAAVIRRRRRHAASRDDIAATRRAERRAAPLRLQGKHSYDAARTAERVSLPCSLPPRYTQNCSADDALSPSAPQRQFIPPRRALLRRCSRRQRCEVALPRACRAAARVRQRRAAARRRACPVAYRHQEMPFTRHDSQPRRCAATPDAKRYALPLSAHASQAEPSSAVAPMFHFLRRAAREMIFSAAYADT
jgi:hypothetical protein